jgi:predicted GNAT superfamily acetyltransferase
MANPESSARRVTVHRARRIEELEQVSQLQGQIWGTAEVAAPSSLLKAISEAGGVVLLAREGSRPVGFAFGFVGRDDQGRLYHRSHAAGVLPELRDAGVGRSLKLAQRRWARAQGLDRMVWTFDPAQLRNAHFNLHRLGAVARRHHPNYYGRRTDDLNQGRPTDRLVVEWFLSPVLAGALRLQRRRGGLAIPVPAALLRTGPPPLSDLLRLRRRLRRALGEGLAIVDYDRERGAYVAAELPAGFPPPAE